MEKKPESMEIDVGGEATFAGRRGCLLAARSPFLEADLLAVAKEKVAGDTVCRSMEVRSMASKVFVPDSESLELVFDSESLEHAPDSMENELELLPQGAFVCTRCDVVHEDRRSWNRAHSRFWPCSRCGLVHMEYMVLSMFYGFDEFDCQVFIPDLDNVVMHGDSIKFDAQVLKKLSEKRDHDLAARKVMFMQRSKYSCCHMFKKNTETTQYLTSLAASFLAAVGGCVARTGRITLKSSLTCSSASHSSKRSLSFLK
jgi:hypothetical protein